VASRRSSLELVDGLLHAVVKTARWEVVMVLICVGLYVGFRRSGWL
jgi:hypothetical protein